MRTFSIKQSKFIFLMKMSWILMLQALLLQLLQANPGYAQSWDWVNVSIHVENGTLVEILDVMEDKSGFQFRYDELVAKRKERYSIHHESSSVKTILQDLANRAGLRLRKREQVISVAVLAEKLSSSIPIVDEIYAVLSGSVLDAQSKEPLQGASILVKGTRIGTLTNAAGRFSLEVPEGAKILVVSYVGYATREVEITGQNEVNLLLDPAVISTEDVVVIGYGTESRANITTSIAKVGTKELKEQAIAGFDQALAGRLAGVDISQTNGAPGASVAINIRGISSITGGNSPLIVIDGVPLSESANDAFTQGQSIDGNFNVGYRLNPLSTINPSDIASVEILKDAASAAIYGSRGTNGVILITTKSGTLGQKPTITFSGYGGVQQVTKKVDVMEAYEFADYTKRSRDLAWIFKNPNVNKAEDPLSVRTAGERYAPYLIPYLNGEQGLTDTDWQDEIFQNAPIQNYEISVNGGSEKLNYYVSGNYFNQEGIVINSGMKRYGARLNLKAALSERISLGINFNPSFSDHNIVQTEQNWFKEGVIISALMYHPNLPVRNQDGSLVLGQMIRTSRTGESTVATIENPVALAELIDNSLQHTRMLGNSYLQIALWDKLSFKTSLGVDLNFMDRRYYRPKTLNWRTEYAPTTTFNYAWTNNSTILNWINENTLNYSNLFGKHAISALLGFTAQKEENKRQYLEGRNFPNDNVISLNAAQTRTGFSEDREWALLSYIGRVQYNYDAKYLLSASLRRDGSSRFGQNTKWGWFPSVSAGWRMSEESFFPEQKVLDDLKLRASYGLTGNTDIPFYGGTALLGNASYVLSDQLNTGLAPSTSPNPNLSWESTQTFDIGLDLGFFGGKLNLVADFYQSKTKDLLLNVTVPSSSGFQSSLRNIGEMKNTGFEFTLSSTQKFGKVSWEGSFNFSTNENEVIALGPGQKQILVNGGLNDPAFIIRVGESIGSYFGYKVQGVFRTQEEYNATPKLENQNQRVGDFIYADANGDGKVNTDDRVILGDNNPDYALGFSSTLGFQGFDFSFNIQSKQGFELFNSMHRYTAEAWGNNLEVYLSENAPRPVWGVGSASHTRPSSWHVEDGSFVRVRNLTLGYTFPQNLMNGVFEKGFRLYLSALNPFTFTNYSGYNPEVSNNFGDAARAGEEFGNYPVAKSIIGGISISF